MYLSILKKDLKRKKTMNLIILLFVVLSAMFFASSVNNIISIAGGVGRYFDMAGIGDYTALMVDYHENGCFEEKLRHSSASGWRRERCVPVNADNVSVDGEKMGGFSNSALLIDPSGSGYSYFDENNNKISAVESGKVYVTAAVADKAGLEKGDILSIEMCGETLSLEYAGVCKDAALGSDVMDNPRFLTDADSFGKLRANEEIQSYWMLSMYYIDTDDTAEIEKLLADTDGVRFKASREQISSAYIVNLLIAGVILAVSICLIIIAFVVLRFTIGFTIDEDFREIGVMKAVGLKNRSVRSLYIIKYLGIATAGAAVGAAAAIPFGKIMLSSVSRSMILGNDHVILTDVLCCLFVVGIILLFCWGCTAKINKLSPIDAVRSGQTGERFAKHASLSLVRSGMGADLFLAVNDVFSSPRQTVMLTAVFTMCAILVMMLSSTAATLSSDKLLFLINVTHSDVYLVTTEDIPRIMGGTMTIAESCGNISRKLSDSGLAAQVIVEEQIPASMTYGGRETSVRFMYCHDTRAEDYVYGKGTPPRNEKEIAVSYLVAERTGVDIGEKVLVNVGGNNEEYLVTALFDSLNNLGMTCRFHESKRINDTEIANLMAYQIYFDDAPDSAVIKERTEKIKEIFGTNNVYDSRGYVNDCTKAADAVMGAKKLTLIVAVMVLIMISVLVERSFISKEKSEIALMKALGFKSRSVVHIHVMRFMVITLVSLVMAAVLSVPVTKLVMDPIFAMMGAAKGIDYAIDPVETFVIFPVIIFGAVIAGALLTALYTKNIKASDTADIE